MADCNFWCTKNKTTHIMANVQLSCGWCKVYQPRMKSCPCKSEVYCSTVCQRQDWKEHRRLCNRGEVSHDADPLITVEMCQQAVCFVFDLQEQKLVPEQEPVIVLLPPRDRPQQPLRLISLVELALPNPSMQQLLSQVHDEQHRQIIHLLWFTDGKVLHKRVRRREEPETPEDAAEVMLMAWLTEPRNDRSVACFVHDRHFSFLVDSAALLLQTTRLQTQHYWPRYLVRRVGLPGEGPDTDECFSLLTWEAQETRGAKEQLSDAVAEYYGLTADKVLLLRTDRCWQCYLNKYEAQSPLQVCKRCRTARYCSFKCHRQDWKQHKALCSILCDLERLKLPNKEAKE
jgi:hypothetical protein